MNLPVPPGQYTSRVECADGFVLGVRVFEPVNPRPQMVLLSPANGVPARFYYPFAAWLAGQGFVTVTWDWRGLGDAAPASMRNFRADMLDWACKDQPAVFDWALQRYQLPIIGIGHSFGGQVFGLAGCPERFDRVILFAASNAFWRLWPRPDRYVFRAWISLMRAMTNTCGYLPGKRLGLGADLPAGVAMQWLAWCLEPDYHQRWDGHAAIRAPVISYAFSDDRFAPPAARSDLMQRYGGAKTLVTQNPREFGVHRVGHLDFFRRRHADTLWPAFLPQLQ